MEIMRPNPAIARHWRYCKSYGYMSDGERNTGMCQGESKRKQINSGPS
jgi:hypothetical protein